MNISQVYPGIWRISIVWRENPGARTCEIYVINGRRKTILVDVGKCAIVSPTELMRAVESTGAHMDDLSVFLTHAHLDHSGNVGSVSDWGIPVFGGPREPATPPGEDPHEYFPDLAGVPAPMRDECILNYLDMVYPPVDVLSRIALAENGVVVEADPWRFEVLHTPGHSLESCCLYERKHKILFVGDTVLGGFVPPVNTTSLDCRKVHAYLSSLDGLKDLDVELVLPGHGDPLVGNGNYRARIGLIGSTHCNRLAKASGLLERAENGLSAYELMRGYVTYQVKAESVSVYYTVSHIAMMLGYLEHLHDAGAASRTMAGRTARYEFVPEDERATVRISSIRRSTSSFEYPNVPRIS